MRLVTWERVTERNETWLLAIVFGLASIPWTYALVAGLHIPLWPSFIASATYYSVGDGLKGLSKGYASNVAGIIYAALTIVIVSRYFGGEVLALSFVVGLFMFLASLHDFIPLLSFTPGGFFGYATMFSIHAANATAFGIAGLSGETIAAVISMFIGAVIGLITDGVSSIFG
ncbi:MAG: DUF1097 domain-containing protein [Halobacteriaceae archaeon]